MSPDWPPDSGPRPRAIRSGSTRPARPLERGRAAFFRVLEGFREDAARFRGFERADERDRFDFDRTVFAAVFRAGRRRALPFVGRFFRAVFLAREARVFLFMSELYFARGLRGGGRSPAQGS